MFYKLIADVKIDIMCAFTFLLSIISFSLKTILTFPLWIIQYSVRVVVLEIGVSSLGIHCIFTRPCLDVGQRRLYLLQQHANSATQYLDG